MYGNWDGVGVAEGTKRYFETVLRAVRMCERLRSSGGRVFDVLGHLDFVKRYSQRFLGSHDVSACPDLIDDILESCLAAELVPEINTSTLRQHFDETMPGPAVVARYAELGGEGMSIGSDAHRSDDVGSHLDHAAEMIREAGMNQIIVFKDRERNPIPLV